jgi:hypothetical protein
MPTIDSFQGATAPKESILSYGALWRIANTLIIDFVAKENGFRFVPLI